MNNNVRVGTYVRVSSVDQIYGYGLDLQKRGIQNCIEANPHWILQKDCQYRDEGLSGTDSTRPGLRMALDDAKAGKYDVLVFWKIDRLGRSLRLIMEIADELASYDVSIRSATEPFDSSPNGTFTLQMLSAFAELDRNNILTRTMEGKLSSALRGNYVGGRIPFGYYTKDRALFIDEDEAYHVKNIFDWFVNKGWSTDKIARTLTERRVMMKKENRIKNIRSKNNSDFWHQSTIVRILKNETYAGRYHFNKHGRNRRGQLILKPQNQWIMFSSPRIIDENTFQAAQGKIENTKAHSNNAKRKYLLSTKIVCGECGSIYTGYTSTKKTKNYRCGKNNKSKTSHPCTARQISEEKIGSAVWQHVHNFLKNPEQELRSLGEKSKTNSLMKKLKQERSALNEEIQKMDRARERVRTAYRMGTFTPEEFQEELNVIDSQKALLQKDLRSVEAQLETEASHEEKVLAAKLIAKRYEENLDNLPYKSKYEILQIMVRRIIVEGNNIKLEVGVSPEAYKQPVKWERVYGGDGGNRTRVQKGSACCLLS